MSDHEDSFSSDLGQWPSVVAIQLHEYQREQVPFVKLWGICDIVETMLRLAAVAGLSELRNLSGDLPESLRQELSNQIDRPTFGQWRFILRKVMFYLPVDNELVADLNGWLDAEPHGLKHLLDAPEGKRSPENSLSGSGMIWHMGASEV